MPAPGKIVGLVFLIGIPSNATRSLKVAFTNQIGVARAVGVALNNAGFVETPSRQCALT
jgi:hypothetical protein